MMKAVGRGFGQWCRFCTQIAFICITATLGLSLLVISGDRDGFAVWVLGYINPALTWYNQALRVSPALVWFSVFCWACAWIGVPLFIVDFFRWIARTAAPAAAVAAPAAPAPAPPPPRAVVVQPSAAEVAAWRADKGFPPLLPTTAGKPASASDLWVMLIIAAVVVVVVALVASLQHL